MAHVLLKDRDVLLECGEETPCLCVRHYYWLSTNAGQPNKMHLSIAEFRM